MNTRRLGLLTAVLLALSACGIPDGSGLDLPENPDDPVLQVASEGGFAPVEFVLGRGPTYTLLAGGRLIFEGPTIAIFPGPLLPNYQVARLDDDQMGQVLELVDQIGLPDFEFELDDSAASRVADATTETVTYWDFSGTHTYSVYALGIDLDEDPSPRTASFEELLELLGELTGSEAEPYQPDIVRVMAGPGTVNDEFEDVRPWPLETRDISDWEELPNGWTCRVFGPEVLDRFTDATQVTVWENPDPSLANSPIKLLVRPLHPGEPGCPAS